MSKKIPYTSGTVEKVSTIFYTLTLYNDGKQVYKATISEEAANTWAAKDKILMSNKNIAVKQ